MEDYYYQSAQNILHFFYESSADHVLHAILSLVR